MKILNVIRNIVARLKAINFEQELLTEIRGSGVLVTHELDYMFYTIAVAWVGGVNTGFITIPRTAWNANTTDIMRLYLNNLPSETQYIDIRSRGVNNENIWFTAVATSDNVTTRLYGVGKLGG